MHGFCTTIPMQRKFLKYCIALLFFWGINEALHAQDTVKIYFDYDRAALTQTAMQRLDSFLQIRSSIDPEYGITIAGHCDARGSDAYNDQLSLQRAREVKNYLGQHGFKDSLIVSVKGLGERQPINEDRDEQSWAGNRRVDILFKKEIKKIVAKKEIEKSLTDQLKDSSVTPGRRLVLRNLNFEGGRHILLTNSIPILQELLTILKENPTLAIAIEGHVCCAQGTPDGLDVDTKTYNLSVNRAKVVYDFLVEKGIDPARLTWDGYGNRYPITQERSEEERTINRRVEIKVLRR